MALEGANKDLGQDAIPKGIVARGRELIGAALANRYVQLGMGAGFGLYRMSRASVPLTPMNVASGVAVTTTTVEVARLAVKGIQKAYGLLNRQSEVQVPDAGASVQLLDSNSSSEADEIVENESPADEAREPALDSETTEVYMTDEPQFESSSASDHEVIFHLENMQAPVEQPKESMDVSESSDPFVGSENSQNEPSPKRPRVEVKSEGSENAQMEIDFTVPAPTPPIVLSGRFLSESEVEAASVEKQEEAPRHPKRKRGQ